MLLVDDGVPDHIIQLQQTANEPNKMESESDDQEGER